MTPDEIIKAAREQKSLASVAPPADKPLSPDEIIAQAKALREQEAKPSIIESGLTAFADKAADALPAVLLGSRPPAEPMPQYSGPPQEQQGTPYGPQLPPQEAPGFFGGMSQLTPGNLATGFSQGYGQMSGMMAEGDAALSALGSGAEFEYHPKPPPAQPPVDRSQMGGFPGAVYDVVSNLAPSVAAPMIERGLPGAAAGSVIGAGMGAAGFGAPTAMLGAAPGAAGGAVIGGGAGFGAGTTVGAYQMAVGDNLQTMKEAGVDAGDAQMIALAYGIPYAGLGMLQLGVAGKYALGALKTSLKGIGIKEITPEIAKHLVVRAVKEGGVLAAATGSEIVTEGGQRGISEGAAATGQYMSGDTAGAEKTLKDLPGAVVQEMKDVAPSMILTGGIGGTFKAGKAAATMTPMDPLKVSREEWVAAGHDPLDHEKAVTEALESGDDERIRKVSAAAMRSVMQPEQPAPGPETAPDTPTVGPPPEWDGDQDAPSGGAGTRIPTPEEFLEAGGDPEALTAAAFDQQHPDGWTADDDTTEFLHAIQTTRESWIAQGGAPDAHRRQVLRGIELGAPVPDDVAAPYYTEEFDEEAPTTEAPAPEATTPDEQAPAEPAPVEGPSTAVEQELPGMEETAPTETQTEAPNAPDPIEDMAVPDAATESGPAPVVEEPPAGMPEDVGEGAGPEEAVAPEPSDIPGELPAQEDPAPPVAPQSMVDEYQATMDLGARPPVYVPVGKLELSKEVPNFKRDADPETGEVQPLEGEFDDRGVAPIAVWRRKDGRLEVISGRHRLAHAKRNNRNSILAQVFNESDGFGAEQAAAMDAELNIRDGHGKVTDYGSYFRRAKLSKPEARKRGLLRDEGARRGFTIGTMGSDDVFTSWENGGISTESALAITETAGADNAGQAIGLNLAISRPQLALDAPRFRETLKALLHMRVQGDSTMDMFGTETYDTAIEEAERRAAIAGRRQREIADKLKIFNATKLDRTKAASLGVDIDVKDEAAVKAEQQRLRVEQERWRDWPQHPDLVAQVVNEEQGVGEANPQVDMAPVDVEVSDAEAAAETEVVNRAPVALSGVSDARAAAKEYIASLDSETADRVRADFPTIVRALRKEKRLTDTGLLSELARAVESYGKSGTPDPNQVTAEDMDAPTDLDDVPQYSAEAPENGPAAAVADRDAVRARILTAVKGLVRGLGLRVNIQFVPMDRNIDGAYKDGTVFLNYEGIINNARRFGVSPEVYVTGKLIHEGIIHHGFSFLSEKSRQRLTAWVKAQVGMDAVRKGVPDIDAYRNLSEDGLVEEYIARIAELARTGEGLTAMQGSVWQRVVATVRKAFRRHTNSDLAAIARTPAEVNKLVAAIILDGGQITDGTSRSTLRWSIESDFKKIRFVSVARMASQMGDRPEYLDSVVRRMSYAHARLMNGEMTTPDVIRAYVITTASIQAGAMDRDLLEEKSGFRVDDEFCEVSLSGVVTVRPEDAAAAWLMTERGERAVAKAARGDVDMKDWENLLFLRRQYGNASVMERMFASNLGGSRVTMHNINELTTRLNEAKTDPDAFHEALRDLNGVGFGKAPFIAHLLGIGTEPTVDAVEINAWLTGKGDVRGASERIRAHAAFLKQSNVMNNYTHKAITKRVKQLAEILGQDIDPAIRATLIHHWLWDAARGTETKHTALYLAMDRMRFSAEADVGNEPHLNAMPRLPEMDEISEAEHDAWLEKLAEWLDGAPSTMAFVDPDGGNNLILVSREAYQEGKWRQTFWHKSGDGWAPGGHITFDTRLDAVRDVSVYGVDYDPHILFSAEDPEAARDAEYMAAVERGDDAGNVIPLSKRFDAASPDIRYSTAQTDTPEFKKWFGGSKVVDKHGEPLVVYHGTPSATFSAFREDAHFTENPEYASVYAMNKSASLNGAVKRDDAKGVYPVFLSIKKPFDTRLRANAKLYNQFTGTYGNGTPLLESGLPDWTDSTNLVDWIKETGQDFDGLILDEGGTPEGGPRGHSWVPLSPSQIKSATGNSGAFSADNPDIRYSAEVPESNPVQDAIQIYGDEKRAAEALIRQIDVQVKSKQVPRRQTMATLYTLVTGIPKGTPGRDAILKDFFRAQRDVQTLEAQYKAEENAEQTSLYEVDPSAQQGFLFSIEDTGNGRPDHSMDSMELVELMAAIIGEDNASIAKYLRPGLNGYYSPSTRHVTIRSDLFAGDTLSMLLYRKAPTPEQEANLQTSWAFTLGCPADEIIIHSVRRPKGVVVRVIRRNHRAALHTMAHEIGHAEDHAPGPNDDEATMKRGRILGRIAKLRKFMGKFLGVVTADERKAMRKQAARDAKDAGFDPKDDKDAYNQAVREFYGEALAARMQETGDYHEDRAGEIPGIRDELEALTQWWRGVTPDQMDAYLKSGEELYADMISVLLNQPEEFQARCPQTYRALGEFFSEHQEMRDTYVEIQKAIHEAVAGNPEELMDRRLERLRKMMLRDADVRRKVIDERNAETPRLSWRRFWQDIVRIIQARDVVLPTEDARMANHDISYVGGRLKQYHRDIQKQVVKVLEDAGISLEDFGTLLMLRRIAYDEGRRDIANPGGTTDESAEQLIDRMRERMGDAAFTAMDNAAEALADIRERHIFPALGASGLVDAEFLAKLRENRYYSTFEVAKYFAQFGGSNGTKLLYKQFGTLNDITNPFYATMATDAQIIWAASNNHAKMKTVEGLRKEAPGEIYEPKWTFKGGTRTPVMDKNPDHFGLLEWREGKDRKAAIVPIAISELYKHNPTVGKTASAIFFMATSFLKRVMTTNNPAFGLGNLMMDFHRTYYMIPTTGFLNELFLFPSLVINYIRSVPDAFRDAFLKQSTPLVREMYEKGLLVPGRTFSARQESGLEAYQRIQKEWDLDVSRHEHLLMRVGRWIFDDFNQSLERLSKIAGYRQLKDSGMTDMDMKRAIRGEIGSPDFLQGGSATPVLNSVFLFSNAGVQSLAAITGAAKRRPVTLAMRITLSVVIPKMIMAYLASGGDDDDDELARRYGMIPDRDKAHRLSFPVPWSDTGYISLPMDRTLDPIGTMIWMMMGSENPNKIGSVTRSATGVLLPFGMDSLNSYIDVVRACLDAAQGINPYDYFRGVPIVDPTTWEAGGFESAKELGKWAYNEIVGSKIGVEFERPYSVRQSKSSSVPVLSPFIRRFYRDSDFGVQEQEMFREQTKARDDARARMPVKKFIADTVRDMEARDDMSPSEIWSAAKEAGAVPEGYKYSTFRGMLTSTLDRRFGKD